MNRRTVHHRPWILVAMLRGMIHRCLSWLAHRIYKVEGQHVQCEVSTRSILVGGRLNAVQRWLVRAVLLSSIQKDRSALIRRISGGAIRVSPWKFRNPDIHFVKWPVSTTPIQQHFPTEVGTGDGSMIVFAASSSKCSIPWFHKCKPAWKRNRLGIFIGEQVPVGVKAGQVEQVLLQLEETWEMNQLVDAGPLSTQLGQVIREKCSGAWVDGNEELPFQSLAETVSACSNVMGECLKSHDVVAVLLPMNVRSMLINTYLTVHGKCVVNLSTSLDNEERMFVMRSQGINVLITTEDLNFTKYAPNAGEVIYIEDVWIALKEHRQLEQVSKRRGHWGRDLRNWFHPPSPKASAGENPLKLKQQQDIVTILCQPDNELVVRCTPVKSEDVYGRLARMRNTFRPRKGSTIVLSKDITNAESYFRGYLLPLFYDLRVRMG